MNIADLFPWEFLNAANQRTKGMIESDAGIVAAVMATTDGFAVASASHNDAVPSRIAALASSISTIGAIATQEAGLGRCSSVILNTDNGFAVVRQFAYKDKDLVLIAIASGHALLAQIMYQANRFAVEMAAV
jgi:predicted regulator of Ras-like GTPase activity (Roadblock/LC7/MglB family)